MSSIIASEQSTERPSHGASAAPPAAVRYTQGELNVLHAFNPVVAGILRSRLHSLLSRRLMLLTYTGRKSGRAYTIPVGYTQDGNDLVVFTYYPWWRNLRGSLPVTLRLQGQIARGRAEVVEDSVAVLAEVERLVTALGAKEAYGRAGIKLPTTPLPTREQLAQALAGTVLVRITPEHADAADVENGRDTARKVLLGAGILSSVLYVASDVVAWLRYPGYSPVDQNFSELLATGAPTRRLMLGINLVPYNALVTALGLGVWSSPRRENAARITGAMLALYALIGAITGGIFNMDMRGSRGTPRGALHPPMTAVQSIPVVVAMISGATLHGRRFRWYSIETLLALAVFGGLTVRQTPQLAAGQPTPWMGFKERVNIYATMAWIAALAISLWPSKRDSQPVKATELGPSPTAAGERGVPYAGC